MRVLFLTVSLGLAVPAIMGVSISKVSNVTGIDPIYIDSDYTLDSDLTFNKDGFIIMADYITLDLNGHKIDCTAPFPSYTIGVKVEGRTGVTVKDGIISQFWSNIFLNNSNGITLTGITATLNMFKSLYGFALENSSGITLTGNTAAESEYGYYLKDSSSNTLNGNTATNNYKSGFYLENSSSNTLNDNTASATLNDGFDLRDSSKNTLTRNIVTENDYGIHLSNSSGNTIYNNYFDNNKNVYDEGTNVWNIAKAPGTNIMGGPYLGGNYFSDYQGKDADGDRIGDTPYEIPGGANRDSLPLVELQWVGAFPIPGGPIGILLATLLLLLAMYPMRRRKRKSR